METLVCNCLIPFCLIQEEEKERDAEAQTARESHLRCAQMRLSDMGLNIPDDSVGRSDRAHPPLFCFFFFFLYRHRWDKSARGAFVVSVLIAALFFMIPMSPVYSTQNRRLSAQTKPQSRAIAFIEPQTLYENMYSAIQARGKGSRQQYLLPFSIHGSHQKTTLEKNATSCQGLHRDSTFFFFTFIVAFCVLFIKNNNGLLSLCLAASQAGTIRGRVIGRAGWGICWRRHGP